MHNHFPRHKVGPSMSKSENQFFLTRAALSACGRAKRKFLSVSVSAPVGSEGLDAHRRLRTWLTLLAVGLLTVCQVSVSAGADRLAEGFALFAKSGPAVQWNWSPVGGSAPVAGSSIDSSGGWKLKFDLSATRLVGLDPSKARIGIVSGPPGSEPKLWLTPVTPFISGQAADSLPEFLFGDAVLCNAKIRIENDRVLVEVNFDSQPILRSPWDLYLLLDTDGERKTGFLGGDFLLQNTDLKDTAKDGFDLAWFDLKPGIVKPGKQVMVTALVQNSSGKLMTAVEMSLSVPQGISALENLVVGPFALRPGEVKRAVWHVSAIRTGTFRIATESIAGAVRARRSQWLSVVAERDPKREFQTPTGAWLPYPPRPTLQSANPEKLHQFRSLPSAKLKGNLFGITAHLPRSTSDEDPFRASHAADGDPATCWASRWWRTQIPFSPEWIQLDIGDAQTAGEFRFLPAWKNSGAPLGFIVQVSFDGRSWETVVDETDYHLTRAPEGSTLRHGELSWQCFPFTPRPTRFVRLLATRLQAGATSFFCAPFEPCQLRIAEMALCDRGGKPVASSRTSVQVSSTHYAWYNSPETIGRTWSQMLNSGVKLNRIGQWGDKIDWATVEKTKGVYTIDPDVDQHITESVKSGIEILMTLDYGNNLYQKLKDPPDHGPTWQRGHPFLQCAPTTPEAVQGFANYCAFMAGHFRGRVKYFEIWNEENGWFFDAWSENGKTSMVRAYGRALAAAAKAVKHANPEAVVVFGGTAGATLDFPRIALDEGAGPCIDIFAFHPYGHPTPESAPTQFLSETNGKMEWKPAPVEITNYEQEIAAFRTLLHRYNPNMQIWADEMNWFAPGEPPMPTMGDQSELTQAKYLARFFAINSWLGCGAIWWSLFNANGIQEWSLIRSSDLTPRAAYFSAGYLATVLDEAHAVANLKAEVTGKAPDDLMMKVYQNRRAEVLIGLWRTSAASDNCRPVSVTLRISQAQVASADLVDTLYGYRQPAVVHRSGEDVIVPDLLVGDWPLFFRAKLER